MMKIRYDINVMKFISLFESMSGARVKDCIELDNSLLFIVEQGEMGKAIGRNGSNINRIKRKINRDVRLVEFREDVGEFVKGLLLPIEPDYVTLDSGILTVTGKDARTRGMIIGRDRSKINQIKSIVARYFDISDIKVA